MFTCIFDKYGLKIFDNTLWYNTVTFKNDPNQYHIKRLKLIKEGIQFTRTCFCVTDCCLVVDKNLCLCFNYDQCLWGGIGHWHFDVCTEDQKYQVGVNFIMYFKREYHILQK